MSTPRSLDGLVALALAACMASALAAPEPSATERERIAKDRLAVERDAQRAQQVCSGQFAVTDCVNRAKAERRERLRPLEQEQALLDEALRKQRATERLAQIQQRQAAQRDAPPQVNLRARRPAAEPGASASANASAPAPAPTRLARPEASRPSGAAADADAQLRAAAAAQRAEQARAHRAAVQEKNRRRAAQREPAKPLPLPPALAASR